MCYSVASCQVCTVSLPISNSVFRFRLFLRRNVAFTVPKTIANFHLKLLQNIFVLQLSLAYGFFYISFQIDIYYLVDAVAL